MTTSPSSAQRLTVAVIGEGDPRLCVAEAVARAGWHAVACSRDASPSGAVTARFDLAVVIERFIERPDDTGVLLFAGVPQLLIRFTDRSLQIGPLVGGDSAPCLSCVTLNDAAEDPALLTMAAQLLGETPATENFACAEAAAAHAVALIHRWLAGGRSPLLARWRAPVHEGVPELTLTTEALGAHAECACRLSDAS